MDFNDPIRWSPTIWYSQLFDDPQLFDGQLGVWTLIVQKSTVIPSSPMVLFVCKKSDCTNFERTQFCLVSSKQKLSIPSRVSQLTGCPGWGTRLLIDTPSHLFFSLRQHPVGEVQRVERKSGAIRKCWKILWMGNTKRKTPEVWWKVIKAQVDKQYSSQQSGQQIVFAARTLRWLATSSIWQGARYQIVTLAKPKLNSVNYDELHKIVKIPSFCFASLCLSGGSEFRSECGSRP